MYLLKKSLCKEVHSDDTTALIKGLYPRKNTTPVVDSNLKSAIRLINLHKRVTLGEKE